MHKGRLEAFSDGVIAIIITIMVLEFKLPHGDQLSDLIPSLPIFLTYIISYVFIGIYWNNHHHMFIAVKVVNGNVLWANLFFLFWLSLIPFFTRWIGESSLTKWPVILYGFNFLMCGIAYYILSKVLMNASPQNEKLAIALGNDWKGKLSVIIYIAGIGLGFINPKFSLISYLIVACIWFIPDKRIERVLGQE